MFSTLPKTIFNFSVTFILSSTNVFNLDHPKIMSFGKELHKPFIYNPPPTPFSKLSFQKSLDERGQNISAMHITQILMLLLHKKTVPFPGSIKRIVQCVCLKNVNL